MANKIIEVAGELVAPFETAAAYKFSSGGASVWLPKSQVEWDADAKEMTMPEWLAIEKELI